MAACVAGIRFLAVEEGAAAVALEAQGTDFVEDFELRPLRFALGADVVFFFFGGLVQLLDLFG